MIHYIFLCLVLFLFYLINIFLIQLHNYEYYQAQYHLSNLVAIIDRNHLQISGNTEDVMPIDCIRERWSAFGWDVATMNGDDMENIIKTFHAIDYTNQKPHLLISETTKGRGVSFMEGIAKWHHGVLNEEQCKAAVAEIEQRIKGLEG